MAEEVVDALLLQARFDDSGLEAQARDTLTTLGNVLRQANDQLPPLDIDATQLLATLKAAGLDVSEFFAGMREEIAAFQAQSSTLAVASAGGGPPIDPPDFSLLAGQLQQLRPAAEGVTRAVAPMNAQMALATTESIRAAEAAALLAKTWGVNATAATSMTEAMSAAANSVSPMAREMSRASGVIESGARASVVGARAFETHGNAAKRAASSLGILAAQTVGVEGPLGRLAELALVTSGGLGAVAAVSVGVILATKAWEFFTKGQREAQKAADDTTEALKKLQEQQKGPVVQAQEQLGTQQGTVDKLAEQLRRVSQARELAGKALTERPDAAGAEFFNLLLAQEADLTKKVADARGLLGTAERAVTEAETAAVQARTSLIASLGRELAVLQIGEDAVARAEAREIGGAGAEAIVRKIQALQAQAQALKDAAEAARVLAQEEKQRDAQFDQARSGSAQIRNTFDDQITQKWIDAREAAEDYFRNVQQGLDSLLTAEEIHQEWIDGQRDAFRSVTDAAAGLVRTAEDIGAIGENAARAALQALDLADAIKEISLTGASFGNIAGIIGAGIGILGSVFGKDATQQEHERIQEANNELVEALHENTAALRGARGIAKGQEALAGIDPEALARIKEASDNGIGFVGDIGTDALEEALKGTGTSLHELQEIARENGIELLDSKGRLVAGAMDALGIALAAAEERVTHFQADSVSDLEAHERNRDALGVSGRSDDPRVRELERARDVQLDALNLSAEEEARIRALDLSTAEGRAAFLEEERDLFRRAQNGELSSDELGLFGDVNQLQDDLGDTAETINDFGDAVEEATDALKGLTNVPETFKLAVAEFAARAVDAPATPFPVGPLGNDPRTTGGSLRTTNSLGTAPSAVITGNTIEIKVTAPPGMSAADVARRVRVELEDGATAQFGLAAPGARE